MTDAKVELTASGPAAQIKTPATAEITDSAGRVITLRRPNVLAELRLTELVGKDAAENQAYMAMVVPLLFVAAIDGDAVPPFSSKRQVEALFSRLDRHGMEAVMGGLAEHFVVKDIEEQKAEVKNS